MIKRIYQIFYEKLPASLNEVLPSYNKCKLITCLNPYYMVKLKEESYELYNEFDYICSDGMGPIKLNRLCGKPKSIRLSFDLSSMAGPVFNHIIRFKKKLYILGAKPNEIEKSVKTISRNFKELQIAGYHHGYISNDKITIINEILNSRANVVIIGMGAPLQDEIAVLLKKSNFIGTIYTCGGFIHQTTNKIISFPKWTNTFGLRWLYRIFTQKGMFSRLITTYPKFILTYPLFLLRL